MKGLAKEHICVVHRHIQQCGDGQREGGPGAGRRGAKCEKRGPPTIVSTIKIKTKR